jgi:hypothetical protein
VVIDRLTSVLKLGRARLQATIKALAGDAYDPLDDTVERSRLTLGTVARNEQAGTEAERSDDDKGGQK